ncbi:reverse transcriptase domain-containing protein [Tanacetum coccineum]
MTKLVKLVQPGIMREVHYHECSQPGDGKEDWDNSMEKSVEYKTLKSACPIGRLSLCRKKTGKSKSLCGFPFKCFPGTQQGVSPNTKDKEAKSHSNNEGTISKVTLCSSSYREQEKDELIVYLAASKEAVSAVLITEREARQMPIYFVSRALRGPKINYTTMEKLVLALIHASKRLRRIFPSSPITVITDQPIKNYIKPEVLVGCKKCAIQLGEFGIHYRPRVSVKGQVLADFIVERPEEEGQDDSGKEEEPLPTTVDLVQTDIVIWALDRMQSMSDTHDSEEWSSLPLRFSV